jgi:drug/metabolite transporter (DMT)-like permease
MEPLLTSAYFLGATAGLLGAIADGFLNKWAKEGGGIWLAIGLMLSLVMAGTFAYMLKRESLGPAILIFLMSNLLFVLLISRLFFMERLTPAQLLAAVLAAAALVLVDQAK